MTQGEALQVLFEAASAVVASIEPDPVTKERLRPTLAAVERIARNDATELFCQRWASDCAEDRRALAEMRARVKASFSPPSTDGNGES